MQNKQDLKKKLCALAQEKQAEFEKISAYIFANPELGFTEFKAQKVLTDELEAEGFVVEKGSAGLETSFIGTYDSGKPGKTIAFMAEYDCLPDIGHACGHNIMGAASTGAGVILKRVMEEHGIGGVLKVIGTPAEENGSGKCIMLRQGVFKDVDAALIMHPTNASMPDDIAFASMNMEYTFHGKGAHSAAFPWKGVNALSGVLQMFHAVDSMRLHLKDYTRVHGIITEGGSAHNTIPEKATALFNLRALDYDYLTEVVKMIENCAKGAAICTGTTVTIEQKGEILKDVKNNPKLVEFARNNMEFIGEKYIERDLTQGIGSTDVGNVTHEIPAIQFYIRLDDNVGTHTTEFAKAAGSEPGKRTLHAAVKVLALSGLDCFIEL